MSKTELENFQNRMIKQIQHFPDNTSNSAALALLGIPPIESHIHKNLLNVLYTILRNPDSIEWQVATRQFAFKTLQDKSLFSLARQLLLQYNLPTVYELMETLPSKTTWKKMLNSAVDEEIKKNWQEDIREKSSLKYINPEVIMVGAVHHLYSTVDSNERDVRKAEYKARLLTGTYPLQANRAAFNQHLVDPVCKLCNNGAETREHFISTCASTDIIRDECKKKLAERLPHLIGQIERILDDHHLFTQLMLDCSRTDVLQTVFAKQDLKCIETISREFILRLHLDRQKQLNRLVSNTG